MNVQKKKIDHNGSILVTLLFMVSVLALLVATVASDSLQTMKTVSQSGRDTQAKYAAYAGMEVVMNELRKEDRYIGVGIDAPNHGHATGKLGELSKVAYDVMIWNNMREGGSEEGGGAASAPPSDSIDAPDGVKVQPDTVYMISTGTDTVQGEEVVLSSLAGTARRVRPVFEDAAYARSKMMIEGADALVDAWDSGGGWNKYVAGEFPSATGGGGAGSHGGQGGGHGGQGAEPAPTVEDYKATLGTDSAAGRTLRLLGGSKLNGHYRIGPGSSGSGAFSEDSGTTSSSGGSRGMGGDSDGGGGTTSKTSYGVATASTPAEQIAGVEGASTTYHKVDDKTTEMPRFVAPYNADDLVDAPAVDNPSSSKEVPGEAPNTTKTVYVPPAPFDLEPGGYKSIDVPSDQNLRLSPGVYYFHEEMKVSGKITLAGSDPVIVFIGKKAVFSNAEINKDGRTSSLQFCFTDEEKDPDILNSLIDSLASSFDAPASGSSSTSSSDDGGGAPFPGGGSSATTVEDYVGKIIAPYSDPEDPESREGASQLQIEGGQFFGSVAGKNLVVTGKGGEIFGGVMANVFKVNNTKIHQDLALKGSNLMNAGGWALEGVHQVR